MKRKILSFILTLVLVFAIFPVTALAAPGDTGTTDGWSWIVLGNNTLAITGNSSPTGTLTVPATLDTGAAGLGTLAVTAINGNAFNGFMDLTGINLPDSLKSIGDSAFSCSGVQSVDIPGSVTAIADNAFNTSVLGSITFSLPSNLQSIGSAAFCNTRLESITIPDSVTNIGTYAFTDCNQLQSVTLPYNASFTRIQYAAFVGCSALQTIEIPDSVTSIEECAFNGAGLQSVTIPASVASIGEAAFTDDPELTGISVDPGNTHFVSQDGVLYDYGQTTLLTYPDGKAGTTFVIPDGVMTINSFAFSGSLLTQITVPRSVTTISDYAFIYCHNLSRVNILSSTVTFGVNNVFGESGFSAAPGGGIYGIAGSTAQTYAANTYVDVNNSSLGYISFYPAYVIVSFDSCGGSEVSDAAAEIGSTMAAPAVPSLSGFGFSGWFTDQTYATPWVFDSDTVSGGMTLYARWTTNIASAGVTGFTAPQTGGTPTILADLTSKNPAQYSVTGITWVTYNSVSEIIGGPVTLDGNGKFTSGGQGACLYNPRSVSGGDVTGNKFIFYVYFPAEINALNISGFVAPVAGATPITADSLIINGCWIESITWEDVDGNPAALTNGAFNAFSTYKAVIVLRSFGTNKFPTEGLMPVVNTGTPSAGVTDGGYTSQNTLTFEVTFPATGALAPAITGPASMTLVEGYAATSTSAYNIIGTAPVNVTKTSGDSKITWNDTTKTLDIASGLSAGSYPVTLTATNSTAPDGTLNFTLTVKAFVPVTSITGVPTTATAGTPLTLTGTVAPGDAINQTIVWSVQDAGTTGATISGNTLSTTAAGTVTVRATITNGLTASSDYTQDFTITVSAASPTLTGVTVSPSAVSVQKGNTQTFTATVTGTNSPAQTVTWSVYGKTSSSTAIDASGLLTVAADETAPTLTVTAASTVDSSKSGSATVTVTATPPAATYTVSFNSNGSGYTTKTVNAGESIGSTAWPADPTRNSYTFGGWFTGENGSGTQFTSAMPVNAATTIYAKWTYIGGGGSPSGGGSTAPATSTYNAEVDAGNGSNVKLPVTVDKSSGNASVDISSGNSLMSKGKTTVITVPSVPDVNTYTLGIPTSILSTQDEQGALSFKTDTGTVIIPSNMLTGVAGIGGSKAEISIGQGEKSNLPKDVKNAIGDRPLVQLTLSIDGKQTDWNNPNAPVTVSIPYTPTTVELAHPESIVIWYIDGSGNAVSVPNGHYDPATRTVTFTTTHFSNYAVVYNKVSFTDVSDTAWYSDAVGFISAKGITTGTGNGKFSPDAKLTRGEFIVMLMKAYDIAPDTNPKDNFTDAGNTYYTSYLAAAKQLGISAGVGNNMFAPGKEIIRQEMFTLLYNALKVIGHLPEGSSGKTLSDFNDAGQIDSWAKDAMTLLVETGTVGGSGGKLSPTATTTRAEMAQVLYNLLAK